VNFIEVAHHMVGCWVLVNTAMKLGLHRAYCLTRWATISFS